MSMIDKIKALREKIPENGATEGEAMAALELAEKLMEKYGITEADLKKVDFQRDMREGSFTQRQKATHPSQKYCLVTISEFCGVKAWHSHNSGVRNKKITRMFGLEGDVEMCEFLFKLVHDSMDRGWKEFLATNVPNPDVSRHTEYWSFMMAFAIRINQKLEAMMEQREAVADSETGTDLVEVKSNLIEEAIKVMLPSLNLKKGRSGSIRADNNAWNQGSAAGDKVNLNRPLTGKGQKRLT